MHVMDKTHKVLGELAVEAGLLTEEQTATISESQLQTDLAFGHLAISLGLLTKYQVESLLIAQRKGRLMLGEAAVQLGYLTEATLESHLKDFRAESEPISESNQTLPTPLAKNVIVTTVIDLLLKFTVRFARLPFKVSPPSNKPLTQDESLLSGASILLRGDEEISFGLFGDRALVTHVFMGLQRIMGGSIDAPETPDDDYTDLLGEILSMVAGHTLAALKNHDVDISVSPPRFDENLSNFATVLPLLNPVGTALLGIRVQSHSFDNTCS